MQKNNIVILLLTSFFAFQALYLTEIYMINYPYAYDITSFYAYLDYFEGDENYFAKFTERLFTDTNSRAIIAPKLVVIPNYLLNNFDSGNIFYMNWAIMGLTLLTIFLIIRDQNKKLYWTLIPISAFIFSPLINNNYWNYTILIWYLPAFCIVLVVYFLNKKHNIRNIIKVLMLSLVATYSIPLGLTVWIAGSVSILKKRLRGKISITYFSSMLIIGIIYYSGNIQQQKIIPFEDFISIRTVFVIATFLAVPFKLKFDTLMITVGLASALISIILVYYLGIVRNKINSIFPWVLFLVIGFTGAIIMRIGRFVEYFKGNLPYYSPIAELFQIGIIMLVANTILEIKNDNLIKNKRIILIFLYSIIALQMLFLIPSYYNGWWKADYYYNEKIDHIECFSLHYPGHSCDEYYIKSLDRSEDETWYNTFIVLNYFKKNDFNLFSDSEFNKDTIRELNEFNEIMTHSYTVKVDGEITKVNNIEETGEYTIKTEDQALFLSGFIIEKNIENIHSMYFIVDGRPSAEFYGLRYSDNQDKDDINDKVEWNFGILKNYLQKGCKTVSIGGIKNNKPFMLDDTVKVCIE